jgi:hypothetical protein
MTIGHGLLLLTMTWGLLATCCWLRPLDDERVQVSTRKERKKRLTTKDMNVLLLGKMTIRS